jgi:hypothetical protein
MFCRCMCDCGCIDKTWEIFEGDEVCAPTRVMLTGELQNITVISNHCRTYPAVTLKNVRLETYNN